MTDRVFEAVTQQYVLCTLMDINQMIIAMCIYRWKLFRVDVPVHAESEDHANRSHFSGTLDLRNADGSLMAFICTGLPDMIRGNLTNSLIACFVGDRYCECAK